MTPDQAMEQLRRSERPFTADDLEDLIGHPDRWHTANSTNNSLGSIFGRYSKTGKIKAVGVTKSRQPSRRGGMIREWVGVPDPQMSLEDAS
jgi:hypothetical protein